jgi:hypothetical protein
MPGAGHVFIAQPIVVCGHFYTPEKTIKNPLKTQARTRKKVSVKAD